MEVLQGLWSGEAFSFHGKHYQVNDVTLLPKPLQSPRIPVWLAGELLAPEEIREIVAYVKPYRTSTEPFDIAMNGETPTDPHRGAEIVQRYSEAGATWWVEFEDPSQSFEEYRERIRQGPPGV